MNIRETTLVALLSYPEKVEVVQPRKRNALYMSSLGECSRYMWINKNQPNMLNGERIIYTDTLAMSPGMELICRLGDKVEDVVEQQLITAGITILGTQSRVYDFDKQVSGKIDFGVDIPGVGIAVIDSKGMSDSVFNRFVSSSSLKEFKPNYYYQLLYYIHRLDIEYGYILGVNRSTGAKHASELLKSKTEDEFNLIRSKLEKILTTEKIDFLTLPEETDESVCINCDFVNGCKPDLFKEALLKAGM